MLSPMPSTSAVKPRVAVLVVAALLGCAAGAARAGESPDIGIAQLGLETWTPDAGLAGSWVRAIAQTPDGFLWLGTSGGLSRFDGLDFVNLTAAADPALPGNGVSALAGRSAGGLWVGFDVGGVRVLENGGLFELAELRPVEALTPVSLLEWPAGTLWIGTASGLYRWRAEALDVVAPVGVRPDGEILKLTPDPRGGLWVRSRAEGLWRIDAGGAHTVPDAPGCAGIDSALTADGRPIVACVNGVWERDVSGTWRIVDESDYPGRVFVDRSGVLWIGGYGGLRRRTGSTLELLPPESGLGDYRVRSFYQDTAGSLWIGSYTAGLARLRRGAVTPVGMPEGLAIEGTTGVLGAADGSLWIGTSSQGALRWQPGRGVLERWGRAEGLPSDWVYAIAADRTRAGRVWLGTDAGLVELDRGRPRLVERGEGRTAAEVRLLYADPRQPDTLWVGGTSGGLDELHGGFVARHDERNGLRLDRVSELRRLNSGELLAAGEAGLFRYDGGRWHPLESAGGELRSVRTFTEAPDGALWLASTERGLVHWRDGRGSSYGEREGLASNLVFSLQLDRSGGLWLSSDEGLARMLVADFERWERGELDAVPFERLAERDGLRDRECNGWGRPASWALDDSRIVYPTSHGVALLDPAGLIEPDLSPDRVFVGRAWTGSRALGRGGPWRLGPEERHLRVRFGAVDFLRPESIQFRFRIDGLEEHWNSAGAKREVNYSYLPPGRYEFRLQARLPGHDWVGAPNAAGLVVDPKLWESAELRLAVLALTALAGLAVYRWRTRVERLHGEAIARERAFLREVVDTSPNPVFAKDRDLRYTLANRAAAGVYGLAPKDVVGRSDRELAGRVEGMEPILDVDRDVLATGEDQILAETPVADASGAVRWFRVVKRPLRGASGAVEQVLGTAVDVTDFKVTEERLRRRESELRASREELRGLTRQLIEAQEEERRRLARELHDDLTQRLAGLAMLTGSLARTGAHERDPEVEQGLEELRGELEQLASDTQALSRDLHPALLENLGLLEALRAECATFGERSGLKVRFEGRHLPAELPPEVSLVLYRIAQEALRNAQAHAESSEIRVTLSAPPGEVVLAVTDAGVGFAPQERTGGRGIGLASMAERARLIGAALEIDSAPGRGTRIAVRVPLPRPAPPTPSD